MDADQINSVDGARRAIERAILLSRPGIAPDELKRRANIIYQDVSLLARCAMSQCLITYSSAIELRGHGNQQNGQWLDEVYASAIVPLGFPDLTMLVVNKATRQPSPEAFNARRSILSNIAIADIPAEQRRCFWFNHYTAVLGDLEQIPRAAQLGRILTPEPAQERELARAVDNAIRRAALEGVEQMKLGKEYPGSLPRAEMLPLASSLWHTQNGKCALTGQCFELRTDEEGGMADDRVSLDRIDNSIGYAHGNVQLVTQFANRARGTLSVEEARSRLVQYRAPTSIST